MRDDHETVEKGISMYRRQLDAIHESMETGETNVSKRMREVIDTGLAAEHGLEHVGWEIPERHGAKRSLLRQLALDADRWQSREEDDG